MPGRPVTTKTTTNTAAMPWLIFAGCCVLSFLGFGIIVNTPGLYFTSLRTSFGVDQSAVSLTVTVQMIVGSLMLLAGGRILEKIDSRLVLSVCVAVIALCFMGCSRVTAFWQFYVLFALIGAAYAVPVLLAPQVLLSNWFHERLGLVMGIALGLSGLSGAVAQPLVTLLIDRWGWRGAYLATGIAFLVLALPFTLFLRFAPDPARGEKAYGQRNASALGAGSAARAAGKSGRVQTPARAVSLEPSAAFRTPSFVLYVIVMILLQIASGLVQHVATFEKDAGLTALAASAVVTGIMLGAAAGKASIGALLDRLDVRVVVLSFVAVALVGWSGMWLCHQPGVAAFLGFLAGLGQGYLLVAVPWLIRGSFGPAHYSRILARANVFSQLMLALATGLHGVLYDATGGSFALSFTLVVAGYVISAVLGLLAWHRRPVRADEGRW
jgi:OFA family oxalate/formate antiporter-like MFS transporter